MDEKEKEIRRAFADLRELEDRRDALRKLAGHYHDPLGTYDYCADFACPRSARALGGEDPYAGEQRSGNLFDIAF